MASLSELSSHERTRVEDYLNDKIQVSADLENLDSLLSSLRAQQELQRKQVPPLPTPTFSKQLLMQTCGQTASGSGRSTLECDKSL